MGARDWFRRTTWTPEDEANFFARLKRCRGLYHKSQYLRIQAGTLCNVNPEVSLRLLDQLLIEYPDPSQLSCAQLQRAELLEKFGRMDEAVLAFRAAIVQEKACPNARTDVATEFPFFIARHQLTQHYQEALDLLFPADENSELLLFATDLFHFHTSAALIYHHSDNRAAASEHARKALAAAGAKHSGFARHPTAGLVTDAPDDLLSRLEKIAESNEPASY